LNDKCSATTTQINQMLDKLEELNSIKKFTEEVDPCIESKKGRERKMTLIRKKLEDKKKRWAMNKQKKTKFEFKLTSQRRNIPVE
jgi:hypothetical protein